jgi:hypothetical protein
MSTLQRTVASFVEEEGIEAPVEARILDLASEVGELFKEALKATNYGLRSTRRAAGSVSWAMFSSFWCASPTAPGWIWRRP